MEIAKATRCGTIIRVLNQKISTSSSSSAATATATSLVKMEMEIETEILKNCDEQRVKQLKRVKQRGNQQHYSHVHHWPPQQQYK